MRFALTVVALAILVVPVAGQHRGRRPNNGYNGGYSRPYYPPRHRSTYRPPTYGYGGIYPAYGYPGHYQPYGYNYYPTPPVDLGLSTFLLRQRQDFGAVPPPTGFAPYAWYDTGAIDPYGAVPVEVPRGYNRGQYGDYGGERATPAPRYAPRVTYKTREVVVDGVPTLTSDN
jgi:hypothetical protein